MRNATPHVSWPQIEDYLYRKFVGDSCYEICTTTLPPDFSSPVQVCTTPLIFLVFPMFMFIPDSKIFPGSEYILNVSRDLHPDFIFWIEQTLSNPRGK